MTKAEFDACCELARERWGQDFEFDGALDGFALDDFKTVLTTRAAVADVIRWQTLTFGGGVDAEAMRELYYYFVKCHRVQVSAI